MFDWPWLLAATLLWLTGIFLIGRLAETSPTAARLVDHPLTFTLSLGGYTGAWALFGSVAVAATDGYAFTAYFFGTSVLFIFAPLLLQPFFNLSRTHRLGSLADLLSFRFNSKWVGALVAIGTLGAVLPLLALQISAVSHTFVLLSDSRDSSLTPLLAPLVFCIGMALLTIRLGSTHVNASSRHRGLVLGVAVQSLFKLLVFLLLGSCALVTVFASPAQLEAWLNTQPGRLMILNESLVSNSSRTLMLIFSGAALAMPHLYHLALTENRSPAQLRYASWAFPLYLLLLCLPVLPILWAGEASGIALSPYFFTLMVGTISNSPVLSLLAYLCGLAAASSCMMVILLAVASMCLNHLILPFFPPVRRHNLFGWLQRWRNGLIFLLLLAALAIYAGASQHTLGNSLTFVAFTAAFQFLPGILAVLYWPRANHKGLIAGLITGFGLWLVTIVLPLLSSDAWGLRDILLRLLDVRDGSYPLMAAIASLGFNMLAFGLVSLLTRTSDEERNVAEICSQDDLNVPNRQLLLVDNVDGFIDRLADVLGQEIAGRELDRALQDLGMTAGETRPFALRLLRRQLEANLSGMFGPTVARQLINRQLPCSGDAPLSSARDIQLIEHRLEHYHLPLFGITRELDNLRRYHRNTLEQLPIGVCTINSDQEILMWNQAMENLTGIAESGVVGSAITRLGDPWGSTFLQFIASNANHSHNQPLTCNGEKRWFTLHKANDAGQLDNQTFLVEETTPLVQLEQELLHNERLASIGRLAAGVAHEIGNPVTGIACLAQNLKFDSQQPEIQSAARDILTQTQRITRIVQSLVNFSHAGSHRIDFAPQPVRLFACIDDAIHLLSLDKKRATDMIDNRVDEHVMINGDTQLLLQMFLNLIKNALDVLDPANGRILIDSQQRTGEVEIRIEDNGPGIDDNVQQHIFEPFFTTKEPGLGTGLGLSLVYGIVEEHQGYISVQSPPPEASHGTRFVLRFPLMPQP